MLTAEASPATLPDQIRRKVEDAPEGASSRAPDPGPLGTGAGLAPRVPTFHNTPGKVIP